MPRAAVFFFVLLAALARAQSPSEWSLTPATSTYRSQPANLCRVSPACTILIADGTGPGGIQQILDAQVYRGRSVRLRASLRLSPSQKTDSARLWLRTLPTGPVHSQDVRTGGWKDLELTAAIPADADNIIFGVTLSGGDSVTVDSVVFESVRPRGESLDVPVRREITDPARGPELPPRTVEQMKSDINGAYRYSLGYLDNLPDFVCTELMRRAEDVNARGWHQRDVLTVQLSYANHIENYRLQLINGQPTGQNLESVQGAQSEGEFGSILIELFRPGSAHFNFDGWATLAERNVAVYRYQVAVENSRYRLMYGPHGPDEDGTPSAHHGRVWIDPDTHEVLRVEQVADPPAHFPIRSASTVLDYTPTEVGGRASILPRKAEVFMESTNFRSHNIIEFRDYRKFGAATVITFEDQ
jgi:hypothetical protein